MTFWNYPPSKAFGEKGWFHALLKLKLLKSSYDVTIVVKPLWQSFV